MLTPGGTGTTRRSIFVSHANPEDNDFARWLTLQLAQHGYDVWCDVADLIGGEDFWRDIETNIRDKAAKFLFVLSQSSNTKPGALSELAVAKITDRRTQLKDFIIPLKIDDLPYGDMNIELARLNAISFTPNWASGLARLIEKLEEDAVFCEPDLSREPVVAWWRKNFSSGEGVTDEEEEYGSNWFDISPTPKLIIFHEISRSGPGAVLPELEFSYPVVPHGSFLISFAEAELICSEFPEPYKVVRSIEVLFSEFSSDDENVANIGRKERRNIVTRLLGQSWELFVAKRGVSAYELANHRKCIYHSHPKEKATRMPFKGINGEPGFRSLTGYRTMMGAAPDSKKRRFWHFAISVKPMTYPILGFAVYYHVLFSDDGRTPWPNKERMHAARRRQCRDWWNDDWRDRILAFLASLSPGNEILALPAGKEDLLLSLAPVLFSSPLSYKSSGKAVAFVDPLGEPGIKQEGEELEADFEEMDDCDDIF